MNVNQEGFDRRLAVVQQILQQYSLQSKEVTPIAYVEHCPFHFNNFIYRVDLASPATFPGRQPCTTAVSGGVSTIVIRLSNPLAGLNDTNRVQNEVAAQFLARQSLTAAGLEPVVPAIYAWAPYRPEVAGEAGFGWVFAEFKSGKDLDGQFSSLPLEDALDVVEQLADIFTTLQSTPLPPTVTKFGALTVNAEGVISSGQMAILTGGPWGEYAEVWAAKLRAQLEEATTSPLIKGWNGGLREQIDDFIGNGISDMLTSMDLGGRVLVHGDLSKRPLIYITISANPKFLAMNNMLYDKAAKRITAILDFDWSCITYPSEEFLAGLWDIGGGISERVGKLQQNIISGDFSTPPDGASAEEARAWEIAKAWDTALAKRGASRPSSIASIGYVQALSNLEQLLCPFDLASPVMLKRRSDEDNVKRLAEVESKIKQWFEVHGSRT